MLFRTLLFALGIYLFYKLIKFFSSMFSLNNQTQADQKVYNKNKTKSHIDKKDVIDAQFEEIEVKEKS